MNRLLFILNDPPYGSERSYNGLRLAGAVARREGQQVKLFLIGDAASCAKAEQRVPVGYYNVEGSHDLLHRQNSYPAVRCRHH